MAIYKPNRGQARMQQVLKDDDITRVFVYSGARSGKTFEFIRTLLIRALIAPGSRHAAIRKHFAQAKKFLWKDTIPAVLDLCIYPIQPELKQVIKFDKSDFYMLFPNGSEIWIGGLDDKDRADRILGGEYNTMYFNEVSEMSYQSIATGLTRLAKLDNKFNGQQLINKAFFDENPPELSHWSYKLFLEGIDPETREKLEQKQTSVLHLHPSDNKENLPAQYLNELSLMTGAERKRFYDGLFQEDIKGALWEEETINKHRISNVPELKRIVIAVDPAVTSTKDSDETGIIVTGIGADNHAYVLADLSGIYTPNQWADKVILAYDKWRADAVVGETNNGGDLVQQNIQIKRPTIRFIKVWASRNKVIRAEPVSGLYERGIVHHIGRFPDLEYQMTTYTGNRDENSPDRLDALVYGITELANPPSPEDIVEDNERVRISSI